MAILLLEGFEGLGTTTGSGGSTAVQTALDYKYINSWSGGTGPRIWEGWGGNGYSLSLGSDGSADQHYVSLPFGSNLGTVYIGFAYRPRANLLTSSPLFGMWESGIGVYNTFAYIMNNGSVKIQLTNFGSLPLTSATVAVDACRPGTWSYIEYKVVIAFGTGGSVIMRINGIEVFNVTGIDTQESGSTASHLRLFGMDGDADTQNGQGCFDDVYISDSGFLGPIKIEHILPNGDTADEDFTLSTGADSYALLDDNPIDDDTTYIESNTSTDKTLVDLAALTYITSDVKAVQVNLTSKVDTGTMNQIPKVKSGTTEGSGTTQGISTTTYKTTKHVFKTNPDTTAAWTVSEVNGMQAGVEVG